MRARSRRVSRKAAGKFSRGRLLALSPLPERVWGVWVVEPGRVGGRPWLVEVGRCALGWEGATGLWLWLAGWRWLAVAGLEPWRAELLWLTGARLPGGWL